MATHYAFDVVNIPIDASKIAGGVYSCLPIPLGLVPVICGALEPFSWPDAYSGSIPETIAAARLVETFIATVATLEECELVGPSCPACGGAGGLVISEELMSGVVTEVTVEDGVLYVWYGGCCVKSFPVDSLPQAAVAQPGETGEFTLPPSVPAWSSSACIKATKIVDVHLSIVDSLLDSAAADRTPWEMMASLKSDVPGIVFGVADTLTAYGYAVGVSFAGLASEAEAPDLYQTMRCRINPLLSDDDAGLTADEYDQVKSTIHSVASDAFPFLLYPINQPGLTGLHKHAIMAIGKNDARNITSYLNATGSEDCSCPGFEQITPDVTWNVNIVPGTVVGTLTYDRRFNAGQSAEFTYNGVVGGPFNKAQYALPLDLFGSTALTEITVCWEPLTPTDELLHNDWHEPAVGGCADLSHAQTGQFTTGNGMVEETQVSGGLVYKRVTYTLPTDAIAFDSFEMRACERDDDKTYNWNLHIVSVNDVPTGIKPQITGWTN